MDDLAAMRRALELAWRGWGRVQPNPLVGAVVLREGEVLGEGYHAEYGGPHAERAALDAVRGSARGATLVLTLEPCNHHGKQPPCTEAVLAFGISRVVAALADPNPVAAGGAAVLRSQGVQVEVGLLADEARAQNAVFLHRVRNPGRPFVALKLATSIDGRIADRTGRSRWVSGPAARDYVQWLRAGFDAIGVGAATARADDPSLTVRGPVQPRVAPARVIFQGTGVLDPRLTLLQSAREVPTIAVAIGPEAPPDHPALASLGVTTLAVPDVGDALRSLAALGAGSLLVEGGGRLAGALLAAEVVDRLYWIQAPVWLGDHGVPAFAGVPDARLDRLRPWKVVERHALGEDTLLVLDRNPCSPA